VCVVPNCGGGREFVRAPPVLRRAAQRFRLYSCVCMVCGDAAHGVLRFNLSACLLPHPTRLPWSFSLCCPVLSCAVLCCPVLSCAVSSSVWESVCQCLCPMEMCQMGTRPHAHPLRGEGSGLSLRNNHVGRALAWPYFLPCRIDTEGFWVGTSLHVFMLRWTL
jgi:hypothetical protein